MKKLLIFCSLFASWSLCAMIGQRAAKVLLQREQRELNQQLISAAKAGDASGMRALLAQGALILVPGQLKKKAPTAFEWAAIKGHLACCNVLLDRLEDTTRLDRFRTATDEWTQASDYYHELKAVQRNRTSILPLFQRDHTLAVLRRCINNVSEHIIPKPLIGTLFARIANKLVVQLSLNTMLNQFSGDDAELRRTLILAGAEYATDAHMACDCEKQEHIERLLGLAIAEENENLLRALIRASGSLHSLNEALCSAAASNSVPMIKLLQSAGASIEHLHGDYFTPIHLALQSNALHVVQSLFESGASLRTVIDRVSNEIGYASQQQPLTILGDQRTYFKILLQGSKKRYAPTKKDAKIAMQNIAQLIYALSVDFPAYIIYEILLFAAYDTNGAQGKPSASEWTTSLRNSLAVLHLYKGNGNRLYPLWEQTVRCLIKDPVQQTRFISKLENFIRPFLGNDVIKIVCSYLMQRIAEDVGPLQQSHYENALFGKDFELYCTRLKESRYLDINGRITPP